LVYFNVWQWVLVGNGNGWHYTTVVISSFVFGWRGIIDANEVINDVANYLLGDDGSFDVVNISEEVQSVSLDSNDNVIITTVDGSTYPLVPKPNLPVIINDPSGDQWTVNEDGSVTTGQAAEGGAPNASNTNGVTSAGNVTQISSPDVQIVLEPAGFYNTDILNTAVQDSDLISKYETLTDF